MYSNTTGWDFILPIIPAGGYCICKWIQDCKLYPSSLWIREMRTGGLPSVFGKETTVYAEDKNEKWDEEKLSEQYNFLQHECNSSILHCPWVCKCCFFFSFIVLISEYGVCQQLSLCHNYSAEVSRRLWLTLSTCSWDLWSAVCFLLVFQMGNQKNHLACSWLWGKDLSAQGYRFDLTTNNCVQFLRICWLENDEDFPGISSFLCTKCPNTPPNLVIM